MKKCPPGVICIENVSMFFSKRNPCALCIFTQFISLFIQVHQSL